MSGILGMVRANLVRLVNDRANVFFIIILPLLLIFALGQAIGGSVSTTTIAVVDERPSELSRELRRAVDDVDGIRLVTLDTIDELRGGVARSRYDAGFVVEHEGDGLTLDWSAGLQTGGVAAQQVVENAANELSMEQAAIDVARELHPDMTHAQLAAARAATDDRRTDVEVERVSTGGVTSASVRAVTASGELVLFVFLTSLFGGQYLLMSRLRGVTRRTLAAPMSTRQVVIGEAISRYVVAALQGALIIVGSWLMFGIDWGSIGAVVAVTLAMALVGSGAAMLLGTVCRTEQQLTALALLLGMVMAALGGSMMPLEYFPDSIRPFAFALTPHAWANDALWNVIVDGAGAGSIGIQVAVLAVEGAVLLAFASWLLARRMR